MSAQFMRRNIRISVRLTEEEHRLLKEKMARIDNCIRCGHCENHCPYGLKTPQLLRRNYENYKSFLQ